MKRTFITFADGKLHEDLESVLRRSIEEFSQYGLKTYKKSDFEKEFDLTFKTSGIGYSYKILACLKALEEYDEIVWIDTDCVVNGYIDKIWFESWRISGYPLLPKARFYLFGRDLSIDQPLPDISKESFLGKSKERLVCSTDCYSSRPFYSQSCFMLFDRSCRKFLEEVMWNYENGYDPEIFPTSDEGIINCILWRDRCSDHLGEIFICSAFFGYNSNEIASMRSREQFANFRYRPIHGSLESILFYHGSKHPEIAESIFYTIRRNRKGTKVNIGPNETILCEIMRRRGSDKSTWHNYTKLYHLLFNQGIGKKISIFELGMGTNNPSVKSNMEGNGYPGSSLRGWKEYFIDARVFGADIDREILFEEEGIKTFYCDQTDQSSIRQMWSREELREEMFDIIIDDGLHEYEANITFLESSLHKLKKGGIYIIEDMLPWTVSRFESDMERLREDHADFEFDMIDIPYERNTTDNSILIARKIS